MEIYTDDGISATSTKKRDGFKRMVADALAGKIQFIITKSVSRFARNTVDSLQIIRLLKDHGVEVWFERENIFTFDAKGELLITLMSSLAQEESRSISENVRWGVRKRMADGKVSLPSGRFLGYEKGEDGVPQIVPEEAQVVRQIYSLFLQGRSFHAIAQTLVVQGIPSPGGKENWGVSTIQSILQNEKYRGSALLQKGITVNFLTKERIKNTGQAPQFYIESSHPGIIEPEVFDMVQSEIALRKRAGKQTKNVSWLSGKLFCAGCGASFGPKTWHSTSAYKRVIWQCNDKYKHSGDERCRTPHVTEEQVQLAFLQQFNALFGQKDEALSELETVLASLTDPAKLQKKAARLAEERRDLAEQMRRCIEANAHGLVTGEEYATRYEPLEAHFEAVEAEIATLESQRVERSAKGERVRQFMATLRGRAGLLAEFDEALWFSLVDHVRVSAEGLEVIWRGNHVESAA
ncbi:MAG: recombinase family protein [Oscillospiraceae bacterium]|nr:recombinase family protein [Oscillospiraceae bacterium]